LDNIDGTASRPNSGSVLSFILPEYYQVLLMMTMRTIKGCVVPKVSLDRIERVQDDPNNRYLVRESEGLSPIPIPYFTIRR
jgi:hypothetical protein